MHFSQFYAQPLAINPAYGGDYKGDVRLAIINRRQWGQLGTPLDTKGASLEKKIRIVNNFLILGGQFLTDKTTAEGLETTMAHFSATFQKAYGKNLLALGVQAGLINRRLNEDQTFPSQFDPSTGLFDPGLNSGENFLVDGKGHPNVNVGILWTSIYRSKIRFKTGASFSHINFPDEAFSGTISRRPIRYLVHHSIEARISPQWTIAPEAQLIYSGGAKQLLTLMRVERKLNDVRSEEHTSELQSPDHLVCRLLLEKKKKKKNQNNNNNNKKKKNN